MQDHFTCRVVNIVVRSSEYLIRIVHRVAVGFSETIEDR